MIRQIQIGLLLAIVSGSMFCSSSSDSSDSTTSTTSTTATTSAPAYSPAAGTYTSWPQSVTITSSTSGAAICYSTTTTPVCNSAKTGCDTGTLYSTAVSVAQWTNLRAIACKSGNNDSSVTTGEYYSPPTAATITTTTATISGSSPFCINNVNTTMDTSLPSMIKDNFKCQVGYVSGTNYILRTVNLPNTQSFYYCSSNNGNTNPLLACITANRGSLWATLPGSNKPAGTNVIASQNLKLTIPSTPTPKSGSLTSTQGGLVAIGLTLNGLAIFNNAANAPDTLSDEAATFDSFYGHPQNTGIYHHHAGIPKLSATGSDTTNNDANLVGIALDGYLIYGKKCDNGTATTADDVTLTAPTGTSDGTSANNTGASATSLDKLHGHTATTQYQTNTYHYHIAADPSAGIDTVMGSYFYGTAGSASN